jgi:hypothetical protein
MVRSDPVQARHPPQSGAHTDELYWKVAERRTAGQVLAERPTGDRGRVARAGHPSEVRSPLTPACTLNASQSRMGALPHSLARTAHPPLQAGEGLPAEVRSLASTCFALQLMPYAQVPLKPPLTTNDPQHRLYSIHPTRTLSPFPPACCTPGSRGLSSPSLRHVYLCITPHALHESGRA